MSYSDPLLTGLLAWYRADGTDRSGNGNTLTAVGVPGTGVGIDGTAGAALSLNGSSGWSRAASIIPAAPTSVTCWYNCASPGSNNPALWLQGASDGSTVPDYLRISSGNLQAALGPSSGAGGPAAFGVWTHVAVTNDGATTSLYVDGALVSQGSAAAAANPTHVFRWGRPLGLLFNSYNGLMQNLGVYGRALSQVDLTRLYNGGAGFDPTLLRDYEELTFAAGRTVALTFRRDP